jgi:hypothetical protein
VTGHAHPARVTLSLPLALEQELRADAEDRDMSISALAAERLAAGRTAPGAIAALEAQVARLETELKARPAPDFEDVILARAPGASELLRARRAAQARCAGLEARLHAALCDARAARAALTACAERRVAVERWASHTEGDRDRLETDLARCGKAIDRLNAEREALGVAHRDALRAMERRVCWRGFLAAWPGVALFVLALLAVVPHDTRDPERAAARLRRQPKGGVDTQLQLHAPAHSGDNRARLSDRQRRAEALAARGGRPSVECVIEAPATPRLRAALLRDGPVDRSPDARRLLRESGVARIVTPDPAPAAAPARD